MAKFYLFMWNSHEAIGGIGDYKGVHATIKEAEHAIATIRDEHDSRYEAAELLTINGMGQLITVHAYTDVNFMKQWDGVPARWVVDDSVPQREIHD